jgi:hypothetical protein
MENMKDLSDPPCRLGYPSFHFILISLDLFSSDLSSSSCLSKPSAVLATAGVFGTRCYARPDRRPGCRSVAEGCPESKVSIRGWLWTGGMGIDAVRLPWEGIAAVILTVRVDI